jgi:hypothetical protein
MVSFSGSFVLLWFQAMSCHMIRKMQWW